MVRYRRRFPRPIFKETLILRMPVSLKQKIYFMSSQTDTSVSEIVRKILDLEFARSKYKSYINNDNADFKKFKREWLEDYREVRDLKKKEKKEEENDSRT
jgi:4-alpha-glucanotransferase